MELVAATFDPISFCVSRTGPIAQNGGDRARKAKNTGLPEHNALRIGIWTAMSNAAWFPVEFSTSPSFFGHGSVRFESESIR